MLIEVALTEEIINESLPIHHRQTPVLKRLLSYTVPIFLFIYGVVFTIFGSNGLPERDQYTYLIVLTIIAILLALWTRYKQNSLGKKTLKLLGDRTHYEVEVNEEELISRLSDATYNQKWTVYPKAVIAKEMVLLYQQNKMYAIFHHSFFANDDFNRFKQLVRNRVHEVKED